MTATTAMTNGKADGQISEADVQLSSRIELLGKTGYAAKGIIYLVVGLLAAEAALVSGDEAAGKRDAIYEIARQPFGQVMLGIIAAGLVGYVTWRFVQAWFDPGQVGRDAKGLVKRAGYGISGLAYASLALLAGSIALGFGSGATADSKDWSATLLAIPFGRWLLGAIGLIVIGVGLFNMGKAWSGRFMQRYRGMSARLRKLALIAGRAGLAARCVTFVMIGGFLIVAAYESRAAEVKGLSGALQTLARQVYGPWLLGTVALGLIAYAIHCFVTAKYRAFEVESLRQRM